MAKKPSSAIDFRSLVQDWQSQFTDLDPKNPSSWPPLPRMGLFVLTALLVLIEKGFIQKNPGPNYVRLK